MLLNSPQKPYMVGTIVTLVRHHSYPCFIENKIAFEGSRNWFSTDREQELDTGYLTAVQALIIHTPPPFWKERNLKLCCVCWQWSCEGGSQSKIDEVWKGFWSCSFWDYNTVWDYKICEDSLLHLVSLGSTTCWNFPNNDNASSLSTTYIEFRQGPGRNTKIS